MKTIHWIVAALLVAALIAAFAGAPKLGAGLFGLSALVELVYAIYTGKKTNV